MSAVTDDIDEISAIDLEDDEYEVVQSLVRNKYRVENSNGEVVFKGKQKMFKMKEEFPFADPDGNDAFSVKAGGILDVAGDYTLIDDQTDEPIVVLDHNWSFFNDVWKIRHPQNEALIATIELQSIGSELIRRFVPMGNFLPHKYEIKDVDDEHVGDIEGQLGMKDRYEVTIDDASDVPTDAVVTAACVIDSIEDN